MNTNAKPVIGLTVLLASTALLGACVGGGPGFDRLGQPRQQTQTAYVPPSPDERGIITYQSYQVAVAMRGDTVRAMADRFGQSVDEMATLNGISADATLAGGEVIVLPRGVDGAAVVDGRLIDGDRPLRRPGEVDIQTLAGDAIEAADAGARSAPAKPERPADEPLRHRVKPGETAAGIAQSYGVTLHAVARFNGLGPDNAVRVGQSLLIPPPGAVVTPVLRPPEPRVARPGQGSTVGKPPSAAKPLPAAEPKPEPAPAPEPVKPADTGTKLTLPVKGSILRDFQAGKSDGLDIAAAPGSPVVAAGDGTVAAITQDSDGVPILVIRHAGGLLTVYAGIDAITVARGETVKRGQVVAVIRDANPSFLHFETRRGFDAVDPTQFLN